MEVLIREFLSTENARDWAKWASFLTDDVTYAVVGSGIDPLRISMLS